MGVGLERFFGIEIARAQYDAAVIASRDFARSVAIHREIDGDDVFVEEIKGPDIEGAASQVNAARRLERLISSAGHKAPKKVTNSVFEGLDLQGAVSTLIDESAGSLSPQQLDRLYELIRQARTQGQ